MLGQPLAPAVQVSAPVAPSHDARIVQAIIGQMPVKEALTTGAAEVTELLTRRGYYKG